jgi:drug/metabolite transporter (DMT)-like permease
MIAAVPLVVVLLAPFFRVSERLGARGLVGFVVGFAGVVLLLGFDTINGPHAWAGVSCIAVATVAYAASPLIVQRHLAGVDELGAVAASLGVATVILLPGVVLSVPATPPSLLVLISLVVLGVACTAVGLLLYFFLIRQAGAARASIVTYINPAVAVLLGVAFLHESFHVNSILGLLLILMGSWVATRSAPEPDPA